MSLDNFILNCERENKRLTIDLNYYKNCSNRLLIENRNLKEQLQQREDIINKAKEYIKNNSHKTEWGDLEQDNESIDINDDVTDTEFITDLLEILDNKGGMKDE